MSRMSRAMSPSRRSVTMLVSLFVLLSTFVKADFPQQYNFTYWPTQRLQSELNGMAPVFPPLAIPIPGRRADLHLTASDQSTFVFGGQEVTNQLRNDLWKFDYGPLWNVWTFHGVEAQKFANQPGSLNSTPGFEEYEYPGARQDGVFRVLPVVPPNTPEIAILYGGLGYSTNITFGKGILGDVWLLDLTTLKWAFVPVRGDSSSSEWLDQPFEDELSLPDPYPNARYSTLAFDHVFNGEMCISGGQNLTARHNLYHMWCFNPVQLNWTYYEDPNGPLALVPELTGVTWSDPDYLTSTVNFYIFGSQPGTLYARTVYRYHFPDHHWEVLFIGADSPKPTGSYPRYIGSRGQTDGVLLPPGMKQDGTRKSHLLVCGGYGFAVLGGVGEIADCWSFSLETLEWQLWQLTSGNETWGEDYNAGDQYGSFRARKRHSMTRMMLGNGDKIVMYGGRGLTMHLSDTWILHMPCEGGDCPFVCADGNYSGIDACNHRGHCEFWGGPCVCDEGASGQLCEDYVCADGMDHTNVSSVCGGHGTCYEPLGECDCHSEWGTPPPYGANVSCTVYRCEDGVLLTNGSVCGGHGSCNGPMGECHCAGNYTKSEATGNLTCVDYRCTDGVLASNSSYVCGGHGSCSATDAECVCTGDWKKSASTGGLSCVDYLCEDGNLHSELNDVCGGHGNCLPPPSSNECVCEEFWRTTTGGKCSEYVCRDGIIKGVAGSCGGHGTCNSANGECGCEGDWKKTETSTNPLQCIDYECEDGVDRSNVSNVCGGHGLCADPEGQQPGACVCNEFWETKRAGVGPFCESFLCQTDCLNGHCSEAGGECTCDVWYYGTDCSNPLISVVVPSGAVGGIAILIVLVVIVALVIGCYCWVKNKQRNGDGEKTAVPLERITTGEPDQTAEEEEGDGEDGMRDVARLQITTSLFELDYSSLKIGRSLGKGGSSATVFAAVYEGEEVAFKCFQLHRFRDNKMFEEFEREVSVMASVSHPNILRFYGATLNPPRVGIVMEFCSNGDIRDYMTRVGREDLSTTDRIRWLKEISSSMNYLNKKSIIHRDLKTENVLLTETLSTRLMDFGLSRLVQDWDAEMTTRIGTGLYMAPEVTLGSDAYGPKVDVFSFGIMMFEILLHVPPYPTKTINASTVSLRVANDPSFRPQFTEEAPAELIQPPSLIRMMTMCWDTEPDVRPDFQTVFDELTGVLALSKEIDQGTGKGEGEEEDDSSDSSVESSDEEEEEEEGEASDEDDRV